VLHIGFDFRAFLNPNRSGPPQEILRRVRIQYPQLTAAKVSNPKFRGKRGNFLDISKGNSHPGMRKFESSEVSQAVRGSEKMPRIVAERPANSGLLQFGVPSLCSRFPGMRTEFGESLWLTPRIFPSLGDAGRRLGSIMDCLVRAAVDFGHREGLQTRACQF
jgi:hypothetical protein